MDLFDALELATRVARVPVAIVVIVFFAQPTTDLVMGVVRQRAADFAAICRAR